MAFIKRITTSVYYFTHYLYISKISNVLTTTINTYKYILIYITTLTLSSLSPHQTKQKRKHDNYLRKDKQNTDHEINIFTYLLTYGKKLYLRM